MRFFNWMLVAVNRPLLKSEPEWPLPDLFSLTVLTSNAAGAAVGGVGGWGTAGSVAPVWAKAGTEAARCVI
jgi:hypothetical protein